MVLFRGWVLRRKEGQRHREAEAEAGSQISSPCSILETMTISSTNFSFSSLSLKAPAFRIKPSAASRRIGIRFGGQPLPLPSKVHSLPARLFPGGKTQFSRSWVFGFSAKAAAAAAAANGGGGGADEEERERLAKGESTMPERFRYLTKEAHDPPLRWPWFVALAFLVYAWRAVLFELTNWRRAALSIVHFVGYIIKLALAVIFHFIGDPVTSTIRCIETAIYSVRAFYSATVAYAPIRELMVIIVLASAVLAVAEATVPNAISSQPYMLTAAGLIGYAAVSGHISEPFFWTLLLGLYSFSRLIKRRDDVTSALPIAALMAGIGEPWVRAVVMASYVALAIFRHSKWGSDLEEEEETSELMTQRRIPLPLLGAGLAIGIRVAARWAGYRHLSWMVV